MANRNKEIKDVVDLRSLKHKKFLSEWGTWVNGTYNVRKKTIDDNSALEIGRKVVANNNEAANKTEIDKLKVDKADKTEVIKKDIDDSYTVLLTTDKISPMVANQTGFNQNDLYIGAIDLNNPNNLMLCGLNRNFFNTADNGVTFDSISLDDFPERIKFEVFNFDGVLNVKDSIIKAFAWKYDGNYGYTYIYKTKDLKTWEHDSTIPRVDGVNKMFIKDRRIYFHTGNITYWWATEPLTALRSRSIDLDVDSWLVHWNIAHDRTTHQVPIPTVNQYGSDGVRFSTFAKYNGKIYDVLFYDRNNFYKSSPDPESYQIWIKPIDGPAICVINIGDVFTSVYNGSAIVKGDFMYIAFTQNMFANNIHFYKVDLVNGSYEFIRSLNINGLKYPEINSNDEFYFFKNESSNGYLKISYDGSQFFDIRFEIENNAKVNVSSNIFGWCGEQYLFVKQGLNMCLFEYQNEKLVLVKRLNNPCPTVDINYTENINNSFLISDNLGNKRLSSDNGKSWALSNLSVSNDAWSITFDSDDGVFLKGDKLTWTGLTLKHMRGASTLRQKTFSKENDYCINTYTYLNPNNKAIWSAYVGKNGKILINFNYRNIENTGTYSSWYFFDNFEEFENLEKISSAPIFYSGEWGKNYGFSYLRSFFDNCNKAFINDGDRRLIANFNLKSLRHVGGAISFSYLENTISNLRNILIQQNEFSGRMNSKDIVVLFNDESYVQFKLPYLPANVKINRVAKYINGYFFLFYTNGMAYYAHENDILSDVNNAFKTIPTGILGKLNDISYNGVFWLAVGDKGMFRLSSDLETWFAYDVCRYNIPESNMFGFDITKENLKPTRLLDFKIDGSSRLSISKTDNTIKTTKGKEREIIKTEIDGITETSQSSLSPYGELTLNNVDVKYEKMEYPSSYNAIAGNSVKVCRVPFNWRGKMITVEFEARKTNSTANLLASFCYDGTSIPVKECKQNKDATSWVKYIGTITLPVTWDKTRLKNGEKYHTDLNTTIVGAFIDIGVTTGNWDVRNIKVTLGEISRPLQFGTDSSECHLFNLPEAWRGCEIEVTYDIFNKGGTAPSSIDIANGPGIDNWILRGSEDLGTPTGKAITKSGFLPYNINTLAAVNNTFKELLYKSPRLGATFYTRSLNSKANTLDFFQQNGFTINFLAGKTISELTYFDFGISGGGNIIVGSSGIEFKNFKARIKSISNTFGFFESGNVTMAEMGKFTVGELMTEKNIK